MSAGTISSTALRLTGAIGLIALLILLAYAPLSEVTGLGLSLLGMACVGLLASWAIFPCGLTGLERVGLGCVLAFLAPGISALILGLSPIGLSQSSAVATLAAELIVCWGIAEARLRSGRKAMHNTETSAGLADRSPGRAHRMQAVILISVLGSLIAAIGYIANSTDASGTGYTILALQTSEPAYVRVSVTNNEGKSMTYRLLARSSQQQSDGLLLQIANGEARTVDLARLDSTMSIQLYRNDEPEVYRTLNIAGGGLPTSSLSRYQAR
jgi:hypothetical protein